MWRGSTARQDPRTLRLVPEGSIAPVLPVKSQEIATPGIIARRCVFAFLPCAGIGSHCYM